MATKTERARLASVKHWKLRKKATARGQAVREMNAILRGDGIVTPSVAEKKAFYESWEWTRLRMETLKRYGAVCMCCGAKAGGGLAIQVDHIKPLAFNWAMRMDPENLQVLCSLCNKGKGAWDETDWRPKP